MDLTPFVDGIRRDLLAAAEVAGPESKVAADRLVAALDAAVRLALMDALATAADEITAELAPASVEVRLRGREPVFVVTSPLPPTPPAPPPAPPPPGIDGDDGAQARISLRVPDTLKGRIEDLASTIGVSVNAWLVRALTDAVSDVNQAASTAGTSTHQRSRRGSTLSGWAR
jgi:hypothetical protein